VLDFLDQFSQRILFYAASVVLYVDFSPTLSSCPNFSSVHVAYSKISLNTPMGPLSVIP